MSRLRCRPGRRLLVGATALSGFFILLEWGAVIWPEHFGNVSLWLGILMGLALVVAAIDLILAWRPLDVRVERNLPSSLSLGVGREIELRLQLANRPITHAEVYDLVPAGLKADHAHQTVAMRPGHWSLWRYTLTPMRRGPFSFSAVALRIPSRLGLWWIESQPACHSETRVYPNFSAIAGYKLLAADNHISQLGIKRKMRRGEGMDFNQLREFREGDSLRQVDWNASSRMHKLISREYQEERDQQLVVMLDNGRRMRTIDGPISHFDASLNAILMLAYVALRQGDSVGVLNFGGQQRWIPGFKGVGNINALLNQLYDLYPENVASDYVAAAQALLQRQRKRSLVVLVSSLRDEDIDDLLLAIKLLQKQHLVLVASLYEDVLVEAEESQLQSLDDALTFGGALVYQDSVRRNLERIRGAGALMVHCRPAELMLRVVNSYLEIKRAGSL